MDAGWEHYRSFLGVLREGSLSAAARTLGLTQPTLGRHIDALEKALKVKLFARTQNGLVPTQSALDMAPHAEAMEAAALSLVRSASGDAGGTRGAVRLTASEIVGAEVLPAILSEFHVQHPQIAIELALGNRNQDLSRRDADIAVRMIRPVQKALIAKRVGTVQIGLYAHRRYLARHGTPRGIAELARHTLIGFDRDASPFRSLGSSGLPVTRETFALRTDNDHAQLNALRAGFGIGGCQAGIAARDSDLVPVLAREIGFRLEMWLVMHEALRANRRVRMLFEHLDRALRAYAAIGLRG